ncbi:hypothetical protein FRC12_005982 [Ceratobasidium sp. 428]|nr:hypothetical protein FRC12_005982 [Ceratobasidium sp. 428]
MTTDTALGVTKRVVADKYLLESLPYVDHPTIRFNAKESVEMPFRTLFQLRSSPPHLIGLGYIARPDGEPILPEGMKELLKEDLNKGFDF